MRRLGMLLSSVLVILLVWPAFVHAFGDEVVVGFMVPLTKKGASYGVQSRAATEVAIEEINAKGGIGGRKLVVITKDTEGDNALAIQLARQLIEKDQVVAIHGPQWSAEAEAVFPICDRVKVLCFSPTSTKPGVSAPYDWAFRNTVDENILVPQTLQWVKQNYPWVKTAAILTDIKDAYSKSLGHDTFRPKLKEFGIEVVESVDYVTGDTDFSAHITKIKARNPDLIAVGGTWVETANMMKEAEKQDLKVLWVGGVGFGNARIMENAGAAAEGAVHNATYDKDNPGEMNQSYVKRLLEKVPNETPHWPAANCYDAMKMLASAITQAKIDNTSKSLAADRKKVRDALAEVKEFPGLTSADGKITMIDKGPDGKHQGDAIKKGTLIQVQNGKFVPVGEGKAASLQISWMAGRK
jgi:branched-chain amino acid transport system substrate-binding protein